jgi:F-type H+-transporting ATPase subunit delta
MSSPLVKTYAKSLFQNLKKAQKEKEAEDSFAIEKITSSTRKGFLPSIFIAAEELALIGAILTSSEKLEAVFKNPTYAESQKFGILLSIFPGLTLTIKSFLRVLTERSHLSLLPEISTAFTALILKFKNTTQVNIVTASQFEDKVGEILLKRLQTVTNSKDIILTITYNPKLLGGLVVEYNSVAIDASIIKEFSLFFND